MGLIVNFILFFFRRDSFITHRAFCDALAEESARAQTHPQPQNQNQAVANPSSESDPKVQAVDSSAPPAPAPTPAPAPASAPVQVSASAPAPAPTPAAPTLPQSTSVISSSVLPIRSSGKYYILPNLEIINFVGSYFV